MRWLLTYSDLVTLLMVFFILMYSIANVDVEKYRGLAQALHGRLGRPDAAVPIPTVVLAAESAAEGELLGPPLPPEPEPEPAPPPAPEPAPPPAPEPAPPPAPPPAPEPPADPLAPVSSRLAALASLQGRAEIRLGKEGIVVSIVGSVLFDNGEARLRAEAEPVLKALAAQLNDLPNQVVVQGSTDNTPVQTPQFPSNWELSAARAAAVVRFFTEQGLGGGRFAAVGYADTRPAFNNATDTGRAYNQRVDIVILRQPLTLVPARS